MSVEKIIAEAPDYTIDQYGVVRDKEGAPVERIIGRHGRISVRLWIKKVWKKANRQVARLLLSAFDPRDNEDDLSVGYHDNNSSNITLENVYWDSTWYRTIDAIGDINLVDAHRLYVIPGYERYSVNCTGTRVWDTLKNKLCPSTNDGNYKYAKLLDQNSVEKLLPVHNLVALTFLDHPKDVYHLLPNHIDGNKHNNHFKNLEWVTHAQNNRHAFETGLRPATKVIMMHTLHRQIKEFPTITAAAKFLSSSANAVHLYLRGRTVKKFSPYRGWWIKDASDPDPFPESYIKQIVSTGSAYKNGYLVKELDTGIEKWFSNLRDISRVYQCNFSTLLILENRDPPEPYRNIMFRRNLGDLTGPWPQYPPEILKVFKEKQNHSYPVKVTNVLTGEVTFHAGIKYWLRKQDSVKIDPAVLSRYLKKSNRFEQWKFEFINLADYAFPNECVE